MQFSYDTVDEAAECVFLRCSCSNMIVTCPDKNWEEKHTVPSQLCTALNTGHMWYNRVPIQCTMNTDHNPHSLMMTLKRFLSVIQEHEYGGDSLLCIPTSDQCLLRIVPNVKGECRSFYTVLKCAVNRSQTVTLLHTCMLESTIWIIFWMKSSMSSESLCKGFPRDLKILYWMIKNVLWLAFNITYSILL